MPIVHSINVWIRRTFGWVVSPQSWLEIAVAVSLIAIGAALWWFGGVFPALLQVILWGLLILVVAVLFRKGWLKLFGPVLFYDMVRSGRRGRYILMRVLYAGLLFFCLFVVFQSHRDIYYGYGATSPQRAAQLAQNYFEVFMAIQLLAIFLLTPAFVAGAISDEKNRRTLEFLLATDLRSREIILSKLGARLGLLIMFVLTGLPILSFIQFLGGVSPNLIIAGFVTTAMTMLGLAGISIFHSTYYKRPRDAIAITYLLVVAYVVISLLLLAFQQGILRQPQFIPSDWPAFMVAIMDNGIEFFNSGNLLIMLPKVKYAATMGTLDTELPIMVGSYSLFYGVLTVACVLWSLLRLRPIALKQAGESKRKRAPYSIIGLRRPPIGESPMLWKELHIEGGLQFNWIGKAIVLLLVGASFVWPIILFYLVATGTIRGGYYRQDIWEPVAMGMNAWVRTMTTVIGCLLLLAIGVRAANSISSERDKQTFDSLLSTPISSNQILAAKWLGSIASVRMGWVWLGIIFTLSLMTGGMHPLALPMVVASLLIYAGFISMLGCWFSVVSKSSGRATVYTLIMAVVLAVGHWLPWMCCMTFWLFGPGPPSEGIRHLGEFQVGLTPPMVLAIQPFYWRDVPEFAHDYNPMRNILIFSLIGLGFWMFATTFLWVTTSNRFRKMTLRESDIRPDFDHLPRTGGMTPQHRPLDDDELATRVYPLHEIGPTKATGAVLLEEAFEAPRPPHEEHVTETTYEKDDHAKQE